MKNRLENSNINTLPPNDVGTVPTPTITIEEGLFCQITFNKHFH